MYARWILGCRPCCLFSVALAFSLAAPLDTYAQLGEPPPPLWQTIHFQELRYQFPTPLSAPHFGDAAWGSFPHPNNAFSLFVTGALLDKGNLVPNSSILSPGLTIATDDNETEFITTYGARDLGFGDVWRSAVALGDYTRDGLLDLIATGIDAGGQTGIYTWISVAEPTGWYGSLEYSVHTDAQYPGLADGDIAWADYNNDGSLDFAVSGIDNEGIARTYLYAQTTMLDSGEQRIAFLQDRSLLGLRFSALAWGDYDNDQDMDLLATGVSQNPQQVRTVLFRNDGHGNFADANAGLNGLIAASIDWGDFDADGDLDILLNGGEIGPFLLEGVLLIYENRSGSFVSGTVPIKGFWEEKVYGQYRGSAQWGDFDNDGDLDFFTTGFHPPNFVYAGHVFENFQTMAFRRPPLDSELVEVDPPVAGGGMFHAGPNGTTMWGDKDGDGDLDLLILGETDEGTFRLDALQNYLYPPNARPDPPSDLDAVVSGDTVQLHWNPGWDEETPVAGLTYNVRIGSSPGSQDVFSSMANVDSGKRLLSARGNADHNLGWKITGLGSGVYYWSVQSIDTSFQGSVFAEEATFVVE